MNTDNLSDLLRRLRFSAEVFFRSEYCGEWAVDTSGTDQIPFHLVAAGEGWLHSAAGSDYQSEPPIRLVTGQLVMFPRDAPHALSGSAHPPSKSLINSAPPGPRPGNSTRLICGYYQFDRQLARPLIDSLPATMILDLSRADRAHTRSLLQIWIDEAADPAPGNELVVDRLAESVFVHMLRALIQNGELRGALAALADDYLGPSLAAIHATPTQATSVPELAALTGLSESAFAQRFKAQVGMSPGHYVRHWRLTMAARLLSESSLSIAAIAEHAGYESEPSFRKAFASYFQKAPGRYRRETTVLR